MNTNKISISGELGSGKTVLAKKLAEHLDFKIISVGIIQRKLAQQYGMDITSFNKYMETHPEIDIECDNMVVEYGKSGEPLILDSRLAWHFVPHSFKVHLVVNHVIASQRIYNDNVRENEKQGDIDEIFKSMVERRKSEVIRFKHQYGVDIDDLRNYDLIIDTSFLTPDEVFQKVLESYQKWSKNLSFDSMWLSPKNLVPTVKYNFNDLKNISADLTSGSVAVCRINNQFYIIDGHKRVSRALKQGLNLVPCYIDCSYSTNFDFQQIESFKLQWASWHQFEYL